MRTHQLKSVEAILIARDNVQNIKSGWGYYSNYTQQRKFVRGRAACMPKNNSYLASYLFATLMQLPSL